MRKVKIYTVVSDELSPPVIGESFCTDMVRHSDYAALEKSLTDMAVQLANSESKCSELAAELSAVDKIHNEAVFITDDHYEQCPPEVQKIIRSLAVLQIPAYDAFLAEVRAQGVESGINTVIAMMNHQHPATSQAIDILQTHAAQLRKGAAL
jgi:hypothetical protein